LTKIRDEVARLHARFAKMYTEVERGRGWSPSVSRDRWWEERDSSELPRKRFVENEKRKDDAGQIGRHGREREKTRRRRASEREKKTGTAGPSSHWRIESTESFSRQGEDSAQSQKGNSRQGDGEDVKECRSCSKNRREFVLERSWRIGRHHVRSGGETWNKSLSGMFLEGKKKSQNSVRVTSAGAEGKEKMNEKEPLLRLVGRIGTIALGKVRLKKKGQKSARYVYELPP